jgi:hypothetical protein
MEVQAFVVSFVADHTSLVFLLSGAMLVGAAAWWRRRFPTAQKTIALRRFR